MIGQAISHYRITGKLGEGGMGIVYKAEDTKLERSVALKFLAPHLLQDAEASRRFIPEAKAAAALDHPNICTVHEIDEVDGRTFIAMAFIEGESLEKKIEAGPLKLKDALDAAIQTAQGLQAAHEKKIFHRDIKPANLMVTPLGSAQRRVIIMDFGLAQLSDRSKLTELDSALGTVAYMSPEQTYGQELDHRTDLWVLGVVVYEMVTGQRPFQGHYEKAVMYSITNEEPEPMTALRTGVPMELEWIVGKCLAKELEERCQNAAELIVDLRTVGKKLESGRSTIRSVSQGPKAAPVTANPARAEAVRTGSLAGPASAGAVGTVAAPAKEQDVVAADGSTGEGPDGGLEAQRGTARAVRHVGARARLWPVVAAVSVVSTLAFAFLYLTESPSPPQSLTFTIDSPEGVTFQTARLAPPVLSPDGTRLAFVGVSEEGPELWIRPLDSLTPERLPGTEGAQYPFWAPDSRFLAFFAGGKLKKIDVTGGPPQTLSDAPGGRGGAWAQDDEGRGVIVFAPTNSSPLHRVSSAGGDSVPVTLLSERGANNPIRNHRQPRFLPGRRRFLYLSMTGDFGEQSEQPVFIGGVDAAPSASATEQKPLLEASCRPWYSPPADSHQQGYLLYVREATLLAHPFDAAREELTGEPFPIAESVYSGGNRQSCDFSVSASGVLTYRQGDTRLTRRITWFDRQGKKLGTVGNAGVYGGPNLSPGGERLAFRATDPQTGNMDIWVRELRRDVATRLTFHEALDFRPVWSPDGTRIAFFSERDGVPTIYQKPANGAGEAEPLFEATGRFWPSHWSRDGRYLVYTEVGSQVKLFALPLQGDRKPIAVAPSGFREGVGTLSPDGAWIAYQSNESGSFEIYARPFPEGEGRWQASTDGGRTPVRSKDGAEIFYFSANRDKVLAVPVKTGSSFEAGVPEVLFELDQLLPALSTFDVTADGQRFIMPIPSEDEANPPIIVVTNWQEALVKQ